MEETGRTLKELEQEIYRLRTFISDIHELSAELIGVDGKVDISDDKKDVAKKIRHEMDRLRELVFIDDLTGAYNRRGFYEHFSDTFKEALYLKSNPNQKRNMFIKDFSVIYIDLDDFKKINDTYGHTEGDNVLKRAVEVFGKHIRSFDGIARMGGEEFVLALVGANEGVSYKKAEETLSDLRNDVKIDGNPDWDFTASIGVASLGASDADNLDELVGYADRAMYEAKINKGKNTVVKYSEII